MMDSRSKSVGTVLCKLRRHPSMALMIMGRREWCSQVPRRSARALWFLFLPTTPGANSVWPPGRPPLPSSLLPPIPIHFSPREHTPPKEKRKRKEKQLTARHLFHLLNKLSVRECAPSASNRQPGGGQGGRRQGRTLSEGETVGGGWVEGISSPCPDLPPPLPSLLSLLSCSSFPEVYEQVTKL